MKYKVGNKYYEVLENEIEPGIRWEDSNSTRVSWYKLLLNDDGSIFMYQVDGSIEVVAGKRK